jgi:hypothetical protein
LMLIELTADDIVVAARARTRGVCPACEPDPRGDHHRSVEVTRWYGEPENCEPDKCASWNWFALTDLPAEMIPYAAQALTHYTKGEIYTERGWDQPRESPAVHA